MDVFYGEQYKESEINSIGQNMVNENTDYPHIKSTYAGVLMIKI